jgi:hypothetical protein
MWMPATEQELLAAIEAGDLVETASFDAKASLRAKGKSKDLAKDVAAMANDGGTLLYDVGEDENDRPTVPQPFRLAGARERVDQILLRSLFLELALQVDAGHSATDLLAPTDWPMRRAFGGCATVDEAYPSCREGGFL